MMTDRFILFSGLIRSFFLFSSLKKEKKKKRRKKDNYKEKVDPFPETDVRSNWWVGVNERSICGFYLFDLCGFWWGVAMTMMTTMIIMTIIAFDDSSFSFESCVSFQRCVHGVWQSLLLVEISHILLLAADRPCSIVEEECSRHLFFPWPTCWLRFSLLDSCPWTASWVESSIGPNGSDLRATLELLTSAVLLPFRLRWDGVVGPHFPMMTTTTTMMMTNRAEAWGLAIVE